MAVAVVSGISAGVTALVGVITTVLDRAAEAEHARLERGLQQAKERNADLLSQSKPPYFYPTLQDRRNLNPKIPYEYSVDGIIESLNNDVVPVGYALSQLEGVGFGDWVKKYRERQNIVVTETANSFADELDALAGVFKDAISGGDSVLRDVARSTGATNDLIKEFATFSMNVRKGKISESGFKAKVRLLQGMLSLIGIEQSKRNSEAELRAKIGEAEAKELDVVQALASRFIAKGF